MADLDRIEELPDRYEYAAKARLSAIDRIRLAADNIEESDDADE